MNQFTSYQILGGIIIFLLGFLCRLGLLFENKTKKVTFILLFFTFIFSLSAGFIVFIFVVDRGYTNFLSILCIGLASFFGSELIPGLGAIKADFFTDIFKNVLKKWLNDNEK